MHAKCQSQNLKGRELLEYLVQMGGIKTDLKKTGCEGVDRIQLTKDTVQWQDLWTCVFHKSWAIWPRDYELLKKDSVLY
jgi:hypothetical protein